MSPLEILEALHTYLTDNGGIKEQDKSQYVHLYR